MPTRPRLPTARARPRPRRHLSAQSSRSCPQIHVGRDHRLAIHPPGSLALMDDPSRTPDFSFVHAADLHLDTPFKGIGSTAAYRKSTRLNSSHLGISYAVFCLQK